MNILMLLYILLSGADIFSFKVFGNTIKVAQILAVLLTIVFIFNKKYKIEKNFLKRYFLLIFIHGIALFYSYSLKKSIEYFLYIIFNLFFCINLIYSWCLLNKNKKLIQIYMWSFRIVGILEVVQFILGSCNIYFFQYQTYMKIFRPAVWFYEPSYLATFFSLYYMSTLIFYIKKIKSYRKDLILSIIFISITTSSTGYITLVVGIILLIVLYRMEAIKKILIISIGIVFSMIILLLTNKDIILMFIGRLFRSGIANSSGERMKVNLETLKVIKNNFLFGIGSNSFKEYTSLFPMNVTLEILATLGVIGMLCFCITYLYLQKKYFKNKNDIYVQILFFSFVLFIIVLQANQNYMRLYMWNHIALYLGVIKNKEVLDNEKINN